MKFEDLDMWKRAARLSANIYKELAHIKDFGFKDQTRNVSDFYSMLKALVESCVLRFILE